MVRHVSSRALGLFVTVGVILGVVAIIWVGASKYFEKGDRFVTYFNESVQGLQQDSAVKYRGVDVGRVEAIRVAPDNRLIEVVMKIRLRDEVEKNNVASLRTAGITGIVFVELDRRDPEEPDLSPRVDFASEYPIIPSRPSQIRQIFSGIDEIVEKIKQVDLAGISKSITQLGQRRRKTSWQVPGRRRCWQTWSPSPSTSIRRWPASKRSPQREISRGLSARPGRPSSRPARSSPSRATNSSPSGWPRRRKKRTGPWTVFPGRRARRPGMSRS